MKTSSLFCFLAIMAVQPFAHASSCIRPPVHHSFQHSHAIVAATAIATSVRRVDGYSRQTVLWRVNETWKGPHYKGSTFTTRTNTPDPVVNGQAYLLYLTGQEPYELQICSERGGLLQDSLQDVRDLYEEFDRAHKLGPNNSFKPKPLRGSA